MMAAMLERNGAEVGLRVRWDWTPVGAHRRDGACWARFGRKGLDRGASVGFLNEAWHAALAFSGLAWQLPSIRKPRPTHHRSDDKGEVSSRRGCLRIAALSEVCSASSSAHPNRPSLSGPS